jgi:hypothetical protein
MLVLSCRLGREAMTWLNAVDVLLARCEKLVCDKLQACFIAISRFGVLLKNLGELTLLKAKPP